MPGKQQVLPECQRLSFEVDFISCSGSTHSLGVWQGDSPVLCQPQSPLPATLSLFQPPERLAILELDSKALCPCLHMVLHVNGNFCPLLSSAPKSLLQSSPPDLDSHAAIGQLLPGCSMDRWVSEGQTVVETT